jgi:hypothetical protein
MNAPPRAPPRTLRFAPCRFLFDSKATGHRPFRDTRQGIRFDFNDQRFEPIYQALRSEHIDCRNVRDALLDILALHVLDYQRVDCSRVGVRH